MHKVKLQNLYVKGAESLKGLNMIFLAAILNIKDNEWNQEALLFP